ncbi:MAG: S1C family serine protease, partial [Alphaproteobacteria bacterium]|nr:S1C family serine protease [Alphaproteobacteria bacterium]
MQELADLCLRARSMVVSVALAAIVAGCTYSGALEQTFHEAKPRIDLDGDKIALSAAVVNGPELQSTKFATFGGFHGVDIPIGDAVAKSVEAELATIFTETTIITDVKGKTNDVFVYPKIEWTETYRDSYRGVFRYDTKLSLIIKSKDRRYTVAKFVATDEVRYVPPAEALGAQALQGASLMVLSPITIPFTTHAVGQEAKRKIGGSISKMVRKIGDELAEDERIREYAAITSQESSSATSTGGSTVANVSKLPRYKRAKSKYDDLLDGVVVIRTAEATGTGFFVSADGYLITNKHVVGNENVVSVKTRDGAVIFGEVVKRHGTKDLALVKIRGTEYSWLRLSNGEDAGIGNDVIAIGTPQGLSWSVSKGIVSAVRDTRSARLIQTDAAVNTGNSGGP